MALIRHKRDERDAAYRDHEHTGEHGAHTGEHGRDTVSHDDHTQHADSGAHRRQVVTRDDEAAREKFGGVNLGAAIFGWLVAIAMGVILTSVVGAIVTAIGSQAQVSQSEAQREAGAIGLTAAIVLLAVMLIAYYTGGYVAGRMSRFDGAKQGVAVWGIGLLITAVAVVLGIVFGSEYNILDRVSLPRIPVPTDTLTAGGLITAGALVLGTLLAAMLGGKVGQRYHRRVDRAAYR